jgi:hypothetical protein
LDDSGNSTPLKDAAPVIRKIEEIRAGARGGLVQGAFNDGDEGVQVLAVGQKHGYSAVTNKRGEFRIRVPPGSYSLKFEKAGWSFEKDLFSYEDPNHFRLRTAAAHRFSWMQSNRESDRRSA